MTMPDTPMKPQDTVIYLLGELKGQVVSLQGSVDASQTSQASINAAIQTEQSNLRNKVSAVEQDVSVLKSQQSPKAPWWSLVSGFAGIGALIAVTAQLFAP